jgi:hypothetical protein
MPKEQAVDSRDMTSQSSSAGLVFLLQATDRATKDHNL